MVLSRLFQKVVFRRTKQPWLVIARLVEWIMGGAKGGKDAGSQIQFQQLVLIILFRLLCSYVSFLLSLMGLENNLMLAKSKFTSNYAFISIFIDIYMSIKSISQHTISLILPSSVKSQLS